MSDTMRIPWGYGTTYKTLGEARTILTAHYHPEYIRRLCAWLVSKNGAIGIGGHWRAGGAQPDKPGFAPDGKSFHQDQNYADGFFGACAVDLVAADGPDGNHDHDGVTWAMVPAQGSAEAKAWGLHCNVGAPGQVGSEPWHMQPVEIDGWQSWWNAGRPAPKANYPIPVLIPPAPEEPAVEYFTLKAMPATLWATSDGLTAVRIESSVLVARGVDVSKVPVLSQVEAARMVYLQGLTSDSVK